MPWQRIKVFMGRRLSRTDYLGLHLTVGLALILLLTLLYVWVAREVFNHDAMSAFDQRMGTTLAAHRDSEPVFIWPMVLVTWLGAFELMLVLVPVPVAVPGPALSGTGTGTGTGASSWSSRLIIG